MARKARLQDLDFRGKRVFVRVDFNVPLAEGKVADDTRIRAALPTLNMILEGGGRPILASHLGRPKGRPEPDSSMAPVRDALAEALGRKVLFASDCVGSEAEECAAGLQPGEVLLLENLRFHAGEKANDPGFADQLARLAERYVNDAFGSAHRAHASVSALAARFETPTAGLLMEKEIDYLGRLLEGPPKPYLVVLGGAKVSDKIPLVRNLMPRVDGFLIGGAMAYTFLAARRIATGASRVEQDQISLVATILQEAEQAGVSIHLPVDHRVGVSLDESGEGEVSAGESIPPDRIGLDIGPKTQEAFSNLILGAATLLWNGPMGRFENPHFDRGSRAIAEAAAASKALCVAGGGDTAAALAQFKLSSRFDHVSTGGGASLEFLSGGELPGIAALRNRS